MVGSDTIQLGISNDNTIVVIFCIFIKLRKISAVQRGDDMSWAFAVQRE